LRTWRSKIENRFGDLSVVGCIGNPESGPWLVDLDPLEKLCFPLGLPVGRFDEELWCTLYGDEYPQR